MELSISDRTEEESILRRHLRHAAAAISREVFHALHLGDELLQSTAFVSVGAPPPFRSGIYHSFATVVALQATRCRVLGDKPWARSSQRAYNDREQASSVLPLCSENPRSSSTVTPIDDTR